MSQLQKKIARVQRRESTRGLGFGQMARERPQAMLLGVVVSDAGAANTAAEAGADIVIFQGANGAAVAEVIRELDPKKVTAGAWLEALDEAGAEVLRDAKCDFVISKLESTASAAVDSEEMGQVIQIEESIDDTTLRALGPLGLDALLVERSAGPMTLAGQLGLVRLAAFAGTPLIVTTAQDASEGELRVLRDSGAAMVMLEAGTGPDAIAGMVERLKAVPAPRRGRRENADLAIVPSTAAASHDHEEPDEDDD